MNCISNPYKFRTYNGTEWRRMFFGAISTSNEEKNNDITEGGYDIEKENEENKEPEYITDFI